MSIPAALGRTLYITKPIGHQDAPGGYTWSYHYLCHWIGYVLSRELVSIKIFDTAHVAQHMTSNVPMDFKRFMTAQGAESQVIGA